MIEFVGDKIILRDFIESDIEKRVFWETGETEWQLWDGPWEYENKTEEEKKAELSRYVETMRKWVKKFADMSDDAMRSGFQIAEKCSGEYIGWVNSYRINEDFNAAKNGEMTAVGIDISALSARGKGYAKAALILFIRYLLEQGVNEIYTQTWSGNTRMIGLAQKLGFEECKRKPNLRFVRGEYYDGLTFRLNFEKFDLLN
ncbi:MAG TPA: GNAT family protein [Oscillospiraceae bacterium]|nr:GNAT family protein [Oscillospiraceae bacterium]HPF56632.1 GNAT family protein [Clostridiales bacterium]HPK34282.1 GNAT family protein [Oscillospiraceae bacterium]HPR74815.1 GNAT family protein [Oscillospiraceae bacterium]